MSALKTDQLEGWPASEKAAGGWASVEETAVQLQFSACSSAVPAAFETRRQYPRLPGDVLLQVFSQLNFRTSHFETCAT